ncbi:MAG: hypothetical protein RL150_146 [Candidatus Parcubacteria bacterium]|jgi:UDP-2-acetamido-3-amino-2,3-dideoxy-glucuronate N-acetyltransferase
MHRKPEIAIVGLGRWGRVLLKELVQQTSVSMCHSRGSVETIDWLQTNYPTITFTDSYENILTNARIDAVVLATPPATHIELAKKAVLAGKNVFVEKPMGESVEDAISLASLADARGKQLAVGYVFTHHPIFAYLHSIINKNTIRSISCTWHKWGSFETSAVTNLLCHDISLFHMFGFTTLEAVTHTQEKRLTETDVLTTIFTDATGVQCSSFINRASEEIKQKKVEIQTDTYLYTWIHETLHVKDMATNETTTVVVPNLQQSAVSLEIQDFISACTHNQKPKVDGWFAVSVLRALDALPKKSSL